MQIGSSFDSGMVGMQRGFSQLDQSAQSIASASTTPEGDVQDGLLGLPQGKIQVQASARVMDVADSMLGTLLDIRV
ncbi:hypothetical protein ACKC9G_07500 [Pokkaliibacter sp. CJK22405]|uniref:hypothetical protein n=1 Tax=Pokkaliibacter sp. CJK22405 TaxID=3384615 RepID=UPI0039850AFB